MSGFSTARQKMVDGQVRTSDVTDSRIIDPLGELLATASRTESILLADISAATVAATRERFQFLRDRRTH